MILLAYAVAILLPLGFLGLIYSQDLYGQGKFRYVLLSFGWGLAAFGAAYGANLFIYERLLLHLLKFSPSEGSLWLAILVAPIVEEVLKSVVLLFLARQMSYFIDGMIYGFVGGTAFSILENVLYLADPKNTAPGVLTALLRVLSTCLMHGVASALAGGAIGRFRYSRGGYHLLAKVSKRAGALAVVLRPILLGGARLLILALGWALAIGLHMGFNRLVRVEVGAGLNWVRLVGPVGIGLGGIVLMVLSIRWGLREEKRWIEEMLGGGTGVSRVTPREVSLVQQYDRLDELLLQPIAERFGQEKVPLVEAFLLKQAQLGIAEKNRARTLDPQERRKLDEEIVHLRREMDKIRRQVGAYCMSYVRLFSGETLALWIRLRERAEEPSRQAAGEGRLGAISEKIRPERPGSGIDVFGLAGEGRKEGT